MSSSIAQPDPDTNHSLDSGMVFLPASLLVALFGDTLWQLSRLWLADANYSHGFLVLPISIGLAWHHCSSTKIPRQPSVTSGSVQMLLGCSLLMASLIYPVWWFQWLSLVLVLEGLAVTVGGHQWARGLLFPILFLFFMFPLPRLWTGVAAFWLQECVSGLSAFFLDLFLTCQLQGTLLRLPGVEQPLVVAEACSGLRQIVAFVALGALLGYFSRRGPWIQVVLMIAALPIAILANTIRVVLMGFGAYYQGTDWLNGPLHDLPALVSFPFGLLLFLLTWYLLDRGAQSSTEEASADGK